MGILANLALRGLELGAMDLLGMFHGTHSLSRARV